MNEEFLRDVERWFPRDRPVPAPRVEPDAGWDSLSGFVGLGIPPVVPLPRPSVENSR